MLWKDSVLKKLAVALVVAGVLIGVLMLMSRQRSGCCGVIAMCKTEELCKQIESYRRRKMTQDEIDDALIEYISSLEKKLDIANVLLDEARKTMLVL